jgi:U3 small nucleolar RNA-associated protein 4
MDIHRSRFVNYPTSAINALAFSHQSSSDYSPLEQPYNLRLAVGRANGDVEIWNPTKGNWFQETVFLGGRNRSIEGLAWTQEPDETDEEGNTTIGRLRLFSIGYSSTVTEWDLETGIPKRHWDGNNGVIWCMAAQPKVIQEKGSTIQTSQKIVVGCADGSLIILSTADDDLQFQKYLTRSIAKRARVLSLAFQNRNTVVAGFADGTIRVFDIESASQYKTISLGAGPKGGPKDILVWAVKCLENGNIVSGDSIGEVRIFEKNHYSQIQRISSHDADILSLAVQKKGSVIFSAGLDRRLAHYVPQRNKREQWLKGGHHSYHEHDVKTMASFEGKGLNVIASGGEYSTQSGSQLIFQVSIQISSLFP